MKLGRLSMIAGLTFVLSPSVMAGDAKTFIGSNCSFADYPLKSHNKIHHRFKNTSGSGQWVTCPLVRDNMSGSSVEHVYVEVYGSASNVRLEQRNSAAGSLSGWNHGTTTNLGSGYTRYNWFDGSTNGASSSDSAYAVEMYLYDDAFISMYKLHED